MVITPAARLRSEKGTIMQLELDLLYEGMDIQDLLAIARMTDRIGEGISKRGFVFDNYVIKLPCWSDDELIDHNPKQQNSNWPNCGYRVTPGSCDQMYEEYAFWLLASEEARKFLAPIVRFFFTSNDVPVIVQVTVEHTVSEYGKKKRRSDEYYRHFYDLEDYCKERKIDYDAYYKAWQKAFPYPCGLRDALRNSGNMGWHEEYGLICIDFGMNGSETEKKIHELRQRTPAA